MLFRSEERYAVCDANVRTSIARSSFAASAPTRARKDCMVDKPWRAPRMGAFLARMQITLRHLRDHAVSRSLFAPTTLARAIERLGFVQADPIRAPARAQDLTLRHRVKNYRAGDLERRYPELAIEEDHFVNYGFLPRRHLAWMTPRAPRRPWNASTRARVADILALVRERGEAHPRDVDAALEHGMVKNAWGGSSKATTHLLEAMQYCGLLSVARREAGIRIYAPRVTASLDASPSDRAEALLAIAIAKYAPLPSRSLGGLATRLRHSAPELAKELGNAAVRARVDLPRARVSGVEWYWPVGEDPSVSEAPESVHLLTPFDPVVWDRHRFELFWGWAYRFEAYTPAPKRKLGYYALPVLWQNEAIGWANVSLSGSELDVDVGYVSGQAPRERAFVRSLDAELESLRAFMCRP